MRKTTHDEAGDSLVEILITLVIVGIVAGALLATYATATSGAQVQRDLVTADTVLRDFAEHTKVAVQGCTGGGTYVVDFTPASSKFTVTPAPGTQASCPPPTTPETVDLAVHTEGGLTKRLDIVVRTP